LFSGGYSLVAAILYLGGNSNMGGNYLVAADSWQGFLCQQLFDGDDPLRHSF